ncbi:PREDICTED: uncharacterized protein LOC105367381 isoform X2 [Ceratosolen solmsi marchali]|uniref:Uncharacterized protein LOC105367381 isoform X2 n=1 Tax=Ceratosolen solmsi marchali TaxID=326594 RepID=A0AAJ7E1L0_9HYME|nr:PREDICTED: uncharacterized protein LOC105367381 isoform X2 [Ceratosolen solmsi marchali]
MKYIVLISFIFIFSLKAEYNAQIPCKTDDTCKNIIKAEMLKCINSMCMCGNITTKSYQSCSHKDIIVNTKQKGVGKVCFQDEDCEDIEGATCQEARMNHTSKRICDCPPHMIINVDKRKCLTIANLPRDSCTESIQCIAGLNNSECTNGKCHCRMNFHFDLTNKRCIPNKVYGDPCTKEEDSCYQLDIPDRTNSLICSDENVCKCLKKYIYFAGLCLYSNASRIVFQTSFVMIMILFIIRMF